MYCRRILFRMNSSISGFVIPSEGSWSSCVHSGFHAMRYMFSDVGDVWVLSSKYIYWENSSCSSSPGLMCWSGL